jgi:FkbM family methyltransferase
MRVIFLKILKIFNFNFKIKHHYTGFNFELNSYLHKGYWFYGKKREFNTVQNFLKLIKPGDTIIEIGGHIGYFSTLFMKIAGAQGAVFVFEPSKENLAYLKKNVDNLPENLGSKVRIVEKGVGDLSGVLDFYLDPITGQNNSFVQDFDGFYANRKFSADKNAELIKVQVPIVQLDEYLSSDDQCPNFVKIDVEGFELNVVRGMTKTIEKYSPAIMIEIQKDEEAIIQYFLNIGYSVYNDEFKLIRSFNEYYDLKTPNLFFVK